VDNITNLKEMFVDEATKPSKKHVIESDDEDETYVNKPQRLKNDSRIFKNDKVESENVKYKKDNNPTSSGNGIIKRENNDTSIQT